MNLEMIKAREELGNEIFNQHLRNVFGISCLDFVETIVINLPEPCYANCEYCIDEQIRRNCISNEKFLNICERVLCEFPNAKNVSITGGTLNFNDFNKLLYLIKYYLPKSFVTWNTNGVLLDENYLFGIEKIDCVNLHRNSLDDDRNREIFRTNKDIISVQDAKLLFGNKLFLRVTVDENFDIDDYVKAGVPLYLNRLLPGNNDTNNNFRSLMQKLNVLGYETKRRNVYIDSMYKDVPVRICVGDKLSKCVPDRKPTYLNVAIIHRSGIVCGSWFENDKVILNPNDLEKLSDVIEESECKKVLSMGLKH